jgi:hypothetical protein
MCQIIIIIIKIIVLNYFWKRLNSDLQLVSTAYLLHHAIDSIDQLHCKVLAECTVPGIVFRWNMQHRISIQIVIV